MSLFSCLKKIKDVNGGYIYTYLLWYVYASISSLWASARVEHLHRHVMETLQRSEETLSVFVSLSEEKQGGSGRSRREDYLEDDNVSYTVICLCLCHQFSH